MPLMADDTRVYCVDWLNYLTSLTLLRSMDPTKPLFDAEMHIFSATKWRKRIVDGDAARAVGLKVLFAAVLGQSGHMVWLWSRNRQGVSVEQGCKKLFDSKCANAARWSAVSMLSQPRGFNAYMRATLLARTYVEDLAALAQATPRIWLCVARFECTRCLPHSTTLATSCYP